MVKNKYPKIKILEKSDLEKLAEADLKGEFAASFYLGLRPEVNFRSEANSVLSGEIGKIKKDKSYTKKDKKKILSLISEIKKELVFLKLPDEARVLVIFAREKSPVQAYRAPVYIPTLFAVEKSFHIHPFLRVVEKFPRHIVAIVDRNRAEIFSIFLERFEGEPEIIESEVPQKIKRSASDDWHAWRAGKISRHIEDHLDRHLKIVAEKIRNYFLRGEYDFWVMGGHPETIARFKKFLDRKLAGKLIGSFEFLHYERREIKEKSIVIIDKYKRESEEAVVKDLMDGASEKKWKAVLGTDSAIKNILRHNAKLLVVGKDYKEEGYMCRDCRFLSFGAKSCFNCGREMRKADLADEIIEEALKNKVKVRHLIYEHKSFDKFGIGVILKRY